MTPPSPPTIPVHGLPVAQIGLIALFEYMLQASCEQQTGQPSTIAYVNANTCNLAAARRDFRKALLNSDLLYLDGNGPRLAAWMAGHRLPPRMTAADWFDDFCELWAREQNTLYFLGSPPGVAPKAAEVLRARHPDLQILGARHGFLTPRSRPDAVEEIKALQPDLLLLAMGSPTQELLMEELRQELNTPLIWAAGGVLDYISGSVPRAPDWMLRLGLEWLGRMLIEPRRLVPRYAMGIPIFVLRSLDYAVQVHQQRLRG